MKMKTTFYLLLFIGILSISGCGGGGGSDPDSDESSDLIARAGTDQTIRSGSQVLLSGKNSEKIHAIRTRTWRAISDLKGGKLVPQRNKGAAKFIAPKVTSVETFKFGYQLTDVQGNVSTDDVEITVVPGDDPDKFLNQNFRNNERIRVVVGTESVESLAQPTEFKISLDLVASYDNKSVTVEDVHQEIDAWWFDSTGGQQPNSLLNPNIWFDLPQLYLSDLPEIVAQTVIPDEVEVVLRVSSAVGGNVSPFLHVYAGEDLIASGVTPLDINYGEVRRALGSDNRNRAQQYYSSIDPGKEKLTLCHWKHENGVTPDIERQVTSNGIVEVADGRIIHQKYINGYDLGFGRDMYVYQKNSGDVSAWVVNYPFIDAMEQKTDTIATVVMEYGPLNGTGERFTRFFTYIESLDETLSENYLVDNHQIPEDDHCFNTDGTPKDDKGLNPADFRRKLSYGLDFDGRGYRYMPEACTVCHGGIGLDEPIAFNGDVEANFLPWDIHNLFFDDNNFEQRPVSLVDGDLREFILENSEDNYKALNEAVLQTRTEGSADPIRELIHGWYDSSGTTSDTLPETASFNSDFVPDGWQQNPDMYKKVVGPMCRTCHIARTEESGLAFTTEDQFSLYINQNNRSLIEDQRVMPLARLTMDNLWGELDTSSNNNGLLELSNYLGGNLKKSVKPLAFIRTSSGLTADVGTSLIFDAFASVHYQTLSWSVTPSTGAILTSTDEAQIGFSASENGEYTVTLRLQNGDQTATDSVTVVVSGGGDPTGGNAVQIQNGKLEFRTSCQQCHATKDTSGGSIGPNLTCAGNKVIQNLGSIDIQMSNISLSSSDVSNIQTYLNSFSDCASNVAPQADAGTYTSVTDSDDNGQEFVLLDASGSSDAEDSREELSFVWTLNGTTIGTTEQVDFFFNPGTHTVQLLVTDSDGASDTDEAQIVVLDFTAPVRSPEEQGMDRFQASCAVCHSGSSLSDPVATAGVSAQCGSTANIERMGLLNDANLSSSDITNIQAYLGTFDCDQRVNTAPVARISGGAVIVEIADNVNSSGQQFKNFTLDGSSSSDSETAQSGLSYEWRCGSGGVVHTGSTYTRDFTVGQCDWNLTVYDNGSPNLSSTATVDFTVQAAAQSSAEFTQDQWDYSEDSGRVRLTVRRTGGTVGDLRMHFIVHDTVDTSAVYREDFFPIDGDDNLIIRQGSSEVSFSFDIEDDSLVEGTEDFVVLLYRGFYDASDIFPDQLDNTYVTIQDNDTAADNDPIANAGSNQSITINSTQTSYSYSLNATGSTDDNGAGNLSYLWESSSDNVNFSFHSTSAIVSYSDSMPLSSSSKTTYFRLTVEDSAEQSDTDTMQVVATRAAPVVTDIERGEDLFTDNCTSCHDGSIARVSDELKESATACNDGNVRFGSIESVRVMSGVRFSTEEYGYLRAFIGC